MTLQCDHCQHWTETDEWEAATVGFKKCNGVKQKWKIEDEAVGNIEKYPDNEPLVKVDWDEVGERWLKAHTEAFTREKAFLQDASSYVADMFTAPDFFCKNFSLIVNTVENSNKAE